MTLLFPARPSTGLGYVVGSVDGDRVVVEGVQKVAPGAQVTAVALDAEKSGDVADAGNGAPRQAQ